MKYYPSAVTLSFALHATTTTATSFERSDTVNKSGLRGNTISNSAAHDERHRSLQAVNNAISCPLPGTATELTSLSTTGGTLTLSTIGTTGQLCTLTKQTVGSIEKDPTIVPLARSYDNEPWSNAAGETPAVMLSNGFNCFIDSDSGTENWEYCSVDLPPLDVNDNSGEMYVLTTYEHSLSERDQVSRFLSQATFGVTTENLNHPRWVGGDNSTNHLPSTFATWVEDQMDTSTTPFTSHREFFRRRANAPVPGSSFIGAVMDPCTAPSRWRTLAVGAKEWAGWAPTFDPIGNTTWYRVLFNGQFRTMLNESNMGTFANNKIPVDFSHWEELFHGDIAKMPYVVDLPMVGEDPSMDKIVPFDGPTPANYLLRTPLGELPSSAGGLCDPSTNPNGIPRLEVFSSLGAIVGRFPSSSGLQWLIYDGHVEFRDNDIANPLIDGGGKVMKESTGGYDIRPEWMSPGKNTALCSNVPRTFLNSQGCKLSLDENACRGDALVDDGKAVGTSSNGDGILVCGSPGEVSNDITFSHQDSFFLHGMLRITNPIWTLTVIRSVWSHLSIKANDQLRQRAAFALNQIFAVVRPVRESEPMLNYHDIFVRNAFGNWKDLLREVSFSPIMAMNLSYLNSKSMAYVRATQNQLSFADENFAREVMQLFNIGTVLLNEDGTLKRDANGDEIDAYSNSDIMTFARAWTGFAAQKTRGNFEADGYTTMDRPLQTNSIDPMRIVPEYRDKFPKTNLFGGYIGDTYPLCKDLPPKAFLQEGAMYRFIGGAKLPESMQAKPEYLDDDSFIEFELSMTSQLRAKLCEEAGADCKSQPPSNEVVLASSTLCDSLECDVDTIRVVKVAEGRYWEYIRQPCVELAFFEDGKELGLQQRGPGGASEVAVCANPSLPVAFEACCGLPSPTDGPTCEQCSDNDACTKDLCDEGGECSNVAIPGCNNGAIIEYWYNINWDGDYSALAMLTALKNDARYPTLPDKTVVLGNTLEGMRDGDWYGARMRTYVTAPKTGLYRLWIRGDDFTELWGGSDPQELTMIAHAYRWTTSFDTVASQASAHIELVAGESYYLEAFVVEKSGGDGIAVAWECDECGISREVIPASHTRQTSIGDGVTARTFNVYDDERVTYTTATARCLSQGGNGQCDYDIIDASAHKTGYHWTNNTCNTFIKVSSDEMTPGWIALVHDAASVLQYVDETSSNFFPVVWDNGVYPSVNAMCTGENGAIMEYWYGLDFSSGMVWSALKDNQRFPNLPDKTVIINETLEAVRGSWNKFGARMRTYVTAPKTGLYRFWIRGDDFTELWLSSSADPEGLNLIAFSNRWTTSFDTFSTQKSAFIELVAGESYYLEAYLLNSGGADSIAVAWECAECGISREVIPASHSRQAHSGCQVIEDDCYCPTTVSDSMVHDSMPTSVEHVFTTLFIGAVDPSTTGVLYESETDSITGIIAYKIGAVFDEHTVFEVYDVRTGRTFFLRNIISTVNIGFSHSFRNAPHFMSMLPSETDTRDAEHETEAVLDNYLFHPNTPPFLARLLIQRFNIASNPSPAYVLAVATAFRFGSYSIEGTNFGSGNYGDLSSTIAAILLCPDASATVDADPAAGSLRQPLLKVIAMMRNLNLVGTRPDQVHAISPGLRIGQSPYDYESVFSHFHQDFATRGRGATAGLYAPEEMAMDLPKILEMLNGNYGTVYSYGYNSRYGFGANWAGVLSWDPTPGATGVEVVDEMSTLLTAGRLSRENREIIHQAYSQNGKEVALQLIASTSEFHTTNQVVTKSGYDRLVSMEAPPNENNESDYKAIIYMDLRGGVDSYNMLVPMHCEGTNIYDQKYNMTVDEQYYDIRSSIALDKASLHQIASGGGQPCSQFGLHPSLPKLADLYRGEEALFFANVGYLTDKPPLPPIGLTFGHSSQTEKIASNDGYRVHGHSGVLGRIRDTVQASHKTSAIYIQGGKSVLEGERGFSSSGPIAVSVGGIQAFPKNIRNAANIPNFMAQVNSLNNATMPDSGFMAEAWSSSMHQSFSVLDEIGIVEQVATVTDFPTVFEKEYNPLADQLKMVSRLQQAALQRGVTRDFYSVEYASWDHHAGVLGPQQTMFKAVDDALAAYVAEAKAIGVWESTVLVQVSEFGRTMYPNGNAGSDHGWAGHYFAIGGGLKGGKILGKYPQSIPRTLRPAPTSPWDSVWWGIAQWAGSDNLEKVCPHKHRFEETDMFDAATMFRATGPTLLPSLSPSKSPVTISPTTAQPTTAEPTTAEPSLSPSKGPSKVPVTSSPTTGPNFGITPVPSKSPTNAPVLPSIESVPYQHVQIPHDDISINGLTLLYQGIGNNGSPVDVFPLGQCQGDCDNDSECQVGLVCKQRRNFEVVPGCKNGDFDRGTDYCMSRLGQCQGNCASDFDCNAGLVCKQRSNFEVVAGCEGGNLLDQDTNYCQLKLGQCQGNCVSSEDCQAGLVCMQGTIFELPASCDGGDFDLGTNYCYTRPHDTYLWGLGNNGSPASAFPLPVCGGDCDSDGECAGELKCFQRRSYEPVPGCEGVGIRGNDYCFNPLTQTN